MCLKGKIVRAMQSKVYVPSACCMLSYNAWNGLQLDGSIQQIMVNKISVLSSVILDFKSFTFMHAYIPTKECAPAKALFHELHALFCI